LSWPPIGSTNAATAATTEHFVGFLNSATLRPLQRRDYRTIWFGALISNVGTWMETTALSTLIAKETKSATQVAITAMAGFLPTAFASPIGGALADRFDRKRFLQVTLLLETLCAALLALLVGLGERRTAPLAAVVFVAAMVGSAALPNRQAIMPSLVDPKDLQAAISLGSASWNGGRIFGPLFGILVTTIGPTWAFSINALSFLVALTAWMSITLPPLPNSGQARLGFAAQLRTGFGVARHQPDVRFAIVFISVLAGTAGPFIGLLAIVARLRFDMSAAPLITAQGVGAVLGGLATTRLSNKLGRGRMMLLYLSSLPIVLVVYALAPHWSVAVVAVMWLGGAYIGAMNGAQAIIQMNAPPEARARVLAVFMVGLGATYCLGLLVSGPLADATSIRVATLAQAGATAVGVAVLAVLFPRWWNRERPSSHEG
jgi:MFS family permease